MAAAASYYYIHRNKIVFHMKINSFNPQKFSNKLKQWFKGLSLKIANAGYYNNI